MSFSRRQRDPKQQDTNSNRQPHKPDIHDTAVEERKEPAYLPHDDDLSRVKGRGWISRNFCTITNVIHSPSETPHGWDLPEAVPSWLLELVMSYADRKELSILAAMLIVAAVLGVFGGISIARYLAPDNPNDPLGKAGGLSK